MLHAESEGGDIAKKKTTQKKPKNKAKKTQKALR